MLKARVIPCLNVKDGRTRHARSKLVARTGKLKNRRGRGDRSC